MTVSEIDRANKLMEQIEQANTNVLLLRNALGYHIERRRNPIKAFIMSFIDKDKTKIRLSGEGVAFGGHLMVSREFLEFAEKYFVERRDELKAELDSI